MKKGLLCLIIILLVLLSSCSIGGVGDFNTKIIEMSIIEYNSDVILPPVIKIKVAFDNDPRILEGLTKYIYYSGESENVKELYIGAGLVARCSYDTEKSIIKNSCQLIEINGISEE